MTATQGDEAGSLYDLDQIEFLVAMQAIQLSEQGSTDALTVENIPRPEPDDDELLVRVHAAGVNPLGWLICRDTLPELLDEPLPWIPGWEVSGIVESVGSDVVEFEPANAIYGMVRLPGAGGTFAEYTTMQDSIPGSEYYTVGQKY